MNKTSLYFYGHTEKSGDKKVLSNWYRCNFKDPFDNQIYTSTEQFMMAKKAQIFKDNVSLLKILTTDCPRKAKEFGRQVKNFDEQMWSDRACDIVIYGCYLKFSQNDNLKNYILSTGERILVEASQYDRVWGIGISILSAKSGKPWNGENLLGKCLNQVRSLIKNNQKPKDLQM